MPESLENMDISNYILRINNMEQINNPTSKVCQEQYSRPD
jgi:hypothetical protein